MTQVNDPVLSHLLASSREVLEAMVGRSVTFSLPIEGEALRPRSNVVGTSAFTGSIGGGLVAFYTTLETAKVLTATMLGIRETPVDDEVIDAIGEITNMIAGTLRTKMAADGDLWAVSIPTVTVGSDFYTKCVRDVRRVLCPLKIDEHELFIELIVASQSKAA
ncbi:MAG TPA: chemotaxis protein CheX [Vicinamibacterales bacterium]|nr:chemotaxis protein CheX [Vicinamibacterales bacterium]